MDRMRFGKIDIFRAFDAFQCYLKRPRDNERDRKTDDDEHDDETNDPIRNIEYRKNLSDALRERPTGDDVGDGDLVNVAPLQLGEEVLRTQRSYRWTCPVSRSWFQPHSS